MKKKILLTLTFFALLTSVSAQSLQNFEYSPENNFDRSLNGGETFTQEINFTSGSDQSLPLGVRVTVESNNTDFEENPVGAEFDLFGDLNSDGADRDISFIERLNGGTLIYVGDIDAENQSLSAQSENSLEITVEADPAISPDNFNFEFSVRSTPGFGVENATEEIDQASNQAEVDLDESSVTVSSETGEDVTVESYDEVTVSAPDSGQEFVGGLGVEVTDSSGGEADASGAVSINYDQDVVEENGLDESSMQVYFYNESSLEWTTEGVENISRDLEDNVVEADVTHFSTYGAFAEPEQEVDEESGGGGSSIVISDSDTTDQQDETQEEQDNQDTSQEADQENEESTDEQQQEDTQDQQDSDDPQQQNDQETSPEQGITGQFLGSPTNVGGILVGLLVAMVAALQYFGKIELRSLIELVREKLGQIR